VLRVLAHTDSLFSGPGRMLKFSEAALSFVPSEAEGGGDHHPERRSQSGNKGMREKVKDACATSLGIFLLRAFYISPSLASPPVFRDDHRRV